ncbi:HlyD family efflux transporter periplasmic adaptor subunit [Caloramator sp. mosi_1]|nr:HlyD family efflux transporter periplasmic adaptor subunit [Caloramator sp. mosi_1]WDC84073.1 HlyD family efflux transporter periplasmic adaptor subunit [Caloramator sp. mosi_1]
MILEVNSEQYNCTIKDYFVKNENIFIVLSTKYDLSVFNLQRYIEGYIIKSRYYGYILPRESVVEYNGKKGVFVKKGDYAYFKPIQINHMDYKVCITSDPILKDNDEVVTNPKNLKDKQK